VDKKTKYFFLIPAIICGVLYFAVVVIAGIVPSPAWYMMTAKAIIFPTFVFGILGCVCAVFGSMFLEQLPVGARMCLNFYRFTQYLTQILTSFVSEFVGMCIAFESAV
jgi:hypothetical protein